jgi:hypothetical protein
MSLSQGFYAYLCQKYPKLQGEALESVIAPNLLSPHQIKLSAKLKSEVISTIEAFQALRDSSSYQAWIERKWGPQFNPGNNSLFMSYDFHVTPEGLLKLIEINTNSSFLGLGWEMNQFFKLPWNADFQISDLKNCFLNELQLAQFNKPLKKIVITDDKPIQQRLYLEFVLYRELFKSFGFDCEIADLLESEKLRSADLIYNRSTDFYMEEPQTQELKKIYLTKSAVVSPNSHEYRMLADKENFIDWSSTEFWNAVSLDESHKRVIQSVLPKTQMLTAQNKDQIWHDRKHLFFKPKRAFGSKSAFKGASVAHKAFEDLLSHESLAQELVPAGELNFETPTGPQKFKYDIRCYAYRNQFQGCVGRIYQGQVTNLRTEGGGFAPVLF